MKLNEGTHKQIIKLCNEGNRLFENEHFDQAIPKYNNALNLVPSPKNQWEASTWIYTALGDSYFFKKNFEKATNFFYEALNCPDGLKNPFILLRLGESLFECDEIYKAKNFLLKSYFLEGEDIFAGEDKKYFDLIKDIIVESLGKKDSSRFDQNINSEVNPKLNSSLEKEVISLIKKSNNEYSSGNYIECIRLLELAWNKLPSKKVIYPESYHIAKYMIERYLLINNLDKAKKWSNKIFECNTRRIDSGEREFLAGKVAFERGKLNEAKKLFAIANKKSYGRCFKKADTKYKNFFINQLKE